MAKKSAPIEEPGDVPETAPDASPSAVDDSDPATLLQDIEADAPAITSPPLIGVSEAHLPDVSEIDATKIKTNTLSKQGWVLPQSAVDRAAN